MNRTLLKLKTVAHQKTQLRDERASHRSREVFTDKIFLKYIKNLKLTKYYIENIEKSIKRQTNTNGQET